MCVFCGRFVTRIRDHIMRVHTAEPTRDDEIMSALSRSSKTAKKKRCPLCSAKVLKLKRHLRQVHKTISQVEKEQALASTRRGIFYTPGNIYSFTTIQYLSQALNILSANRVKSLFQLRLESNLLPTLQRVPQPKKV